MIKFHIFFFTSLFIISKTFATDVAVIDVNYLINNSNHFKEVSNKLNESQLKFKEKFKITEQNLYKLKSELEDLKLVLNEDEFNLRRDRYYKKVAEFENEVLKFNDHYENEIINIKNLIFAKISELAQEHASLNGIELIIDKNQYLIASDKININDIIFEKLNESKLELKYSSYDN